MDNGESQPSADLHGTGGFMYHPLWNIFSESERLSLAEDSERSLFLFWYTIEGLLNPESGS